jgi:hypothetical protein
VLLDRVHNSAKQALLDFSNYINVSDVSALGHVHALYGAISFSFHLAILLNMSMR